MPQMLMVMGRLRVLIRLLPLLIPLMQLRRGRVARMRLLLRLRRDTIECRSMARRRDSMMIAISGVSSIETRADRTPAARLGGGSK